MATTNGFDVWLKVTLSDREMKPSELARRIGVTPSSVTNWTKGKGEPGWPQLRKIADALDLPNGSTRRALYVRAGRMTEEEAGCGPLPIPELPDEVAIDRMVDAIPYITRETARRLVQEEKELSRKRIT